LGALTRRVSASRVVELGEGRLLESAHVCVFGVVVTAADIG
jgi:hypothetical protein